MGNNFIKNIFNAAVLGLGVTSLTATAVHAFTEKPPAGTNCHFQITPEMDLLEYMPQRDKLPYAVIDMFAPYLSFEDKDVVNLDIDKAARTITLKPDFGHLIGREFTIDRLQRADETFSLDGSYLDGSEIVIYPDTGFVHVTLTTGESEVQSLKDFPEDDEGYLIEIDRVAQFETIDMRFMTVADDDYFIVWIYASDSYIGMSFHGDEIGLTFGDTIDWQPFKDTGLPTELKCHEDIKDDTFEWNPKGFVAAKPPQP